MTSQLWSRKSIVLFITMSWSIWKKRNELLSKEKVNSYESYLRHECKSLFFSAKKNNSLPFSSRHILDCRQNFFSTAPVHTLNSWLRRFNLGISLAKQNCKTAKSDLRNWFSPIQSTTIHSPGISSNSPTLSVNSSKPHIHNQASRKSTHNRISSAARTLQRILPKHVRRQPSKKPSKSNRHNKPLRTQPTIRPPKPKSYLLTPPIPFQNYLRQLGRKNPPIRKQPANDR